VVPAGAAGGCVGEAECLAGCGSPVAVSAEFASAGPGAYRVTFCKAGLCQEATLQLPDDMRARFDSTRGFEASVSLDAADATDLLTLTVQGLSGSDVSDGEVLVLAVHGPDGAVLKTGVAVTKYGSYDNGCRQCPLFRTVIE